MHEPLCLLGFLANLERVALLLISGSVVSVIIQGLGVTDDVVSAIFDVMPAAHPPEPNSFQIRSHTPIRILAFAAAAAVS